MTTSKIEQLVAMAETDPRVASMMATLFDFIQAENRVVKLNSEEAQNTARSEVRALWLDIIDKLNSKNVISQCYYDATSKYGDTKHNRTLAITARTLIDLAPSFSDAVDGYKRPVGKEWTVVAADIIDMLEGNTPSGVLKPKKAGRQGPQGHSNATLAAWKKLILLINYISGRDNIKMDEACREIGVGHRAYQDNQTKVLKKFGLEIETFRSAKILGGAVSENKHLSKEDQEIVDAYEIALVSTIGLANLRAAANNIFPENE